MGDHGKVYRTYTPEMCRLMGELAAGADLITPNLTEAAILLGEDYSSVPTGQAGMERWPHPPLPGGPALSGDHRSQLCPRDRGRGCFDRGSGKIRFAMARQEHGEFSGTGDLFASVLLGASLRGETLADATAGQWILSRSASPALLRQGPPCWTACSSSRF